MMERTEKPAHVELCHDIGNALIGIFRMGDIIEGKRHARYELEDEQEEGQSSRKIRGFERMRRDLFCAEHPAQRFCIVALRDPFLKPSGDQPAPLFSLLSERSGQDGSKKGAGLFSPGH